MSYRTTIWNRFKQPWWPTSTSASLSLSCCTSQKYTTSLCTILAYISNSPFQTLSWESFLLHAIWILKNQAKHVTTCLCCFCFQGVDLLLLLFCCSIWWRTLRLSTGRTWKNIEARKTQMHLKCSRNRNCDKLESRKLGSQFQQIETARKRQKAPGFQRLCLSVAVPHTRWNQNESKWTKMNQRQYY